MKNLKLYNGAFFYHGKQTSCCIAAWNRADASRLINLANGWAENHKNFCHEIKYYFSECWGNYMEGVIPVRGLWIKKTSCGDDKPVKII